MSQTSRVCEELNDWPTEPDACVHAQSFSRVWLFATPWPVAHQAPLPMDFSRQEYWSGLPLPTPGDLQPRDWTRVSFTGWQILYHQAIWEAHTEPDKQEKPRS